MDGVNKSENSVHDKEMNLSQLKETATELTNKSNGPILPMDGITMSDDEYCGPGMILTSEDLKEEPPIAPSVGLTSDTMDNVNQYLNEMDAEIELGKSLVESKKDDDEEENKEMTSDEFDHAYKEAVVIIDKTGMGSVINFTEDERDKLQKSQTIRLEEIETISIKTIKTKKIKKKGGLETLIQRRSKLHLTPIVLLASGYTATIRGCSTYELIALMHDSQNALMDTEAKWTLIHSKIEDTSIGKMDYNTFLRNTSSLDYPIFLFGILCATYPEDDSLPLKCEKCPTDFNHGYSVKSLIRAEKMTEKMKQLVSLTIDASHTVDSAKAFHSTAPVSMTKTIVLPVSGIVVDLYVQSAYDFINRSIKELSQNKEVKYNQASVLSSVVNGIYIPDPDNDDEYFEVDGAFEITKVIYSLSDKDIIILTKQSDMILEDLNFEFGLMNVQCPNCKHMTQTLPMDLETILFYKYQQAMNTKIE